MKELYLIRHAKSSWKDSSLKDFDRPLNKRGKRDAPFMAQVLHAKNIRPDLLLSSAALRTMETARIFAEQLQCNPFIVQVEKKLYEAGAKRMVEVLKNLPPQAEKVFLFGHNPGLTELANLLTDSYVYNIPTTGIYAIRFGFKTWDLIGQEKGEFLFFEYPKKYFTETD
jgi:phosphohistidine phosphatase